MQKNILLTGFILFGLANALFAQNYQEYYNQSIAAYQASDYQGFLKATQKADSVRPNHPILLYNLANAYVLNDQPERALETLEYRTHFYAKPDFTEDEDLAILQEYMGWQSLVKRTAEMNKPQSNCQLAFSIDEPGFHPEGIAYQSEKDLFLISDVYSGAIYSARKDGSEFRELVRLSEFGYWSAFGIQIDPQHIDQLWVTTTSFPTFKTYSSDEEGRAAVLLFDIEEKRLLERYELREEKHHFGDLVINTRGDVYVSDSGHDPVIYKLNRKSKLPEPFVSDERWWNIQGMAFSEDEKWMYVSDYITGIYRIEMESKEVTPLIDQNEWLRGGDGIYFKDNKLVILQNGTIPKRLATIKIDEKGLGIFESLKFPHQAAPELEEPTLGTWVNDEFYYIANSPWGYYDEQNKPLLQQWPEIFVYRLKNTD